MGLFISFTSIVNEEELEVLGCILGYTYIDGGSIVIINISGVEVLGVASSCDMEEIFVNMDISGHGGSFPTSINLFSMHRARLYVLG